MRPLERRRLHQLRTERRFLAICCRIRLEAVYGEAFILDETLCAIGLLL